MKLAYCPVCRDVFKLTNDVRGCSCGKCSGRIQDKKEGPITKRIAHIQGPVKVIGIDDSVLRAALEDQPIFGEGLEFKAFLLPKSCGSIYKIKTDPESKFTHGSHRQATGRLKRSPYERTPAPQTTVTTTEVDNGPPA